MVSGDTSYETRSRYQRCFIIGMQKALHSVTLYTRRQSALSPWPGVFVRLVVSRGGYCPPGRVYSCLAWLSAAQCYCAAPGVEMVLTMDSTFTTGRAQRSHGPLPMYHNTTTTCLLIRIRAECVQDKLLETPPR